MNHLAHALLAGDDDAVLLGSLLGDFWRGAADPAWPAGVAAGLALHRGIDVYTDSHPVLGAARAAFDPPWRRYAGILLDIYFDHVIARDWQRHGDEPLDAFSARVAALLRRHEPWLPGGLNRFARYFRARGLFAAYARRDVIEQVLQGVAGRLRHRNPLAEAGPTLWAHACELDGAFARFYPDLQRHARDRRRALDAG